ncbi:MAG: type II toxin-antitoxin system VapC family toxin [Thermomicrobiales bacterium]
MKYLVDSDWVIDYLNAQPQTIATLQRLEPDGLAISIITYAEVYEGILYSRDPAQGHRGFRQFLRGVDVLPLTRRITHRFGAVRGSLPRQIRNQVGDMDLLIAATALHHGLTMITNNLRDYQHVPGLVFYQR